MSLSEQALIHRLKIGLVPLPSLAIHAALFLPSLVMTAFSQSSMAVGLTLYLFALCLYFTVDGSFWFWQIQEGVVPRNLALIVGLPVLVLAHAVVPLLNASLFNVERFFSSYLLLCCMVLAAWGFAYQVNRLNVKTMSRWVEQALWFLMINAMIGLTGVHLFPQMSSKPAGLFSEPSHLALVLAPLLIYACAIESRLHRLFLVFFLVWSLLIENLTTLSVVTLSFLVLFRFSLSRMILLFLLISGFVFTDLEYFTSRLVISSESENLSVLVLLQGWDLAMAMLDETSNWGGGFQQFGFIDVSGDITAKIALLSEDSLNLFDGGSTASKLVGEFGVFAFAGLVIYAVLFLWAFRKLRQVRVHPMQGGRLFLISCLFAFVIELFVRGVGYFSPGCFLALSATMGLLNAPQSHDSHI